MKCLSQKSPYQLQFQTNGLCSRMTFGAILTSGVALALLSALVVVGHYWLALAAITQALGALAQLPIALSTLGGGSGLAILSPLVFLRAKKSPLSIGETKGFTHVNNFVIENDEIKNDEIENDEIKNEKVKNEEVKNEEVKNEENDKISPHVPSFELSQQNSDGTPVVDVKEVSTLKENDKKQLQQPQFTYAEFSSECDEIGECKSPPIKVFENMYEKPYRPPGRPWIQYMALRGENAKEINQCPKFHISVDREKMSEAFEVIFPILVENNLDFKIMSKKALKWGVSEKLEQSGNTLGKEFVVYVSDDSWPLEKWKNFLMEIENKLDEQKIQPGRSSDGDVSLLRKGYFHTRSPSNAFGNYIPAEALVKCDFTQLESAIISNPEWIMHMLGDTVKKEVSADGKRNVKALSEVDSQRVEELSKKIVDQYYKDLKSEQRIDVSINTSSLFMLFCGVGVYSDENSPGDAILESVTTHLIKLHPFIRDDFEFYDLGEKKKICLGVVSANYSYGVYAGGKMKEEFLREPLEKAARLATLAGLSWGIPPRDLGNIMPAVYHHFIVPLAERKKNGGQFGDQYFADLEQEQTFIKKVAKCSFRKRGEQTKSLHPVYKEGLSEKDLDTHLNELLSTYGDFIDPVDKVIQS